jgi:hypothetical protein
VVALADAAAGGSSNALPAFESAALAIAPGIAAATGAATVAAVPMAMLAMAAAEGAATAAVTGSVRGGVTGSVGGGVASGVGAGGDAWAGAGGGVGGEVRAGVAGGVRAWVGGGAGGDVRAGERLPGAGKCPPVDPPSWALFAAGLRVGLGPALLSAAAKSWPLAPGMGELADAAPFACAASLFAGACETVGIAFIPTDKASDVPSAAIEPGERAYFRLVDPILGGSIELQYQSRAPEQSRALDPSKPAVHAARHPELGRRMQRAVREPTVTQ